MLRGYLLLMSVCVIPNCPFIFQYVLLFYITTFMFMCEYNFCIHLWVHMSAHIQEGPKLTLCVFSFILFFSCWGGSLLKSEIPSSIYPDVQLPQIFCLCISSAGIQACPTFIWMLYFELPSSWLFSKCIIHWVSFPGWVLTHSAFFLLSRVLPKYSSANVSEQLLSEYQLDCLTYVKLPENEVL